MFVGDVSCAQKALWMIWQQNKKDFNYNLPMAFLLKREIDPLLLSKAMNIFLDKYPSLRVNFIEQESLKQTIHSFSSLQVKVITLHNSQNESDMLSAIKQECRKPFDLESDLLIRVTYFKMTDHQPILLIVCHHIITDGLTPDRLQEIVDIYHHILSQDGLLSYHQNTDHFQFIQKEKEYLNSVISKQDLDFWKLNLSNITHVKLVDSHQSSIPSEPKVLFCHLEADIFKQIQTTARHERCSIFTLFLTALNILIYKYTGSSDICVATSCKNTLALKYKSSPGYFSNTVIVRTLADKGSSIHELIKKTQNTLLTTIQHANYPFSKLIDELKLNMRSECPFPASIVFHEKSSCFYDLQQHELSNLLESIHTICQESEFNLNIEILEGHTDAALLFKYYTDKISELMIHQFQSHYLNILTQLVNAKSHITLAELDILSEKEKKTILIDGNQTSRQWFGHNKLALLFKDCAKRNLAQIAIQSENNFCTYQELDKLSDGLALHLRQIALNEKVIAVCMLKSVDLIVSLLAILKANLAYLPIDPTYPVQRINYLLNDSHVKIVLTDQHLDLLSQFHFNGKIISFSALTSKPAPLDIEKVDDNPAAYVMYTSGSTGNPKPIVISQEGVINLANSQIESFQISATSRVLQFASISFDATVSEIWTTLLSGATLIVPRDRYLSGSLLMDIINRYQISVLTLPPSVLNTLPDLPMPSLKTVVIAGEMANEKLLDTWVPKVDRFINAYGPTETTVCATLFHYETPCGASIIGKPISNVQIYILDADLNPVPMGIPGEIYIAGIGLGESFGQHAELTEAKFITHPFLSKYTSTSPERLYKSGDRAKYLSNGNIQYLGRIDHQIKLRGFRIEPEEIEKCLRSHPDIENAIVLTHEEMQSKEKLYAYIKLRKKAADHHVRQSLWWPSTAEFYVYDDTLYGAMTNDQKRNGYYRDCIRQYCKYKTVVDVGTGKDAILARICIEEGAEHVYAIEYLHDSYLKANKIIEELSLTDRITLIHADAKEVQLDKKVDVIISEIVGPIGGAEGAAKIIASVKKNLLKPEGIIIPHQSITYIAAISLTERHLENVCFTGLPHTYQKKIFDQLGYPFDLRVCIDNVNYDHIASSIGLFENINYNEQIKINYDEHISTLHVMKEATIHGFIIWLTLNFHNDATLDILRDKYCWLPIFIPAYYPGVLVKEGDKIELICSRMIAENELNQDYHIQGFVIRNNIKVNHFEYDMPHFEKRYQHNLFYKTLFSDLNSQQILKEKSCNLEEKIRDLISNQLPAYMIPNQFVFLDSFPKLPNGKINRKELSNVSKTQLGTLSKLSSNEKKIASIFSDILNIDIRLIHSENNFFQLGGSSLSAIQAIAKIKEMFSVSLSVDDFFKESRISTIATRIDKNNHEKNQYNLISQIKNDLLSIPIQISNQIILDNIPLEKIENILLTGVTGFLGIYLLHSLLKKTKANIHCLVRGEDQSSCSMRLKQVLDHYSLSVDHSRIKIYSADLGRTHLGLNNDLYNEIAKQIDSIYHCGALVNHLYGYDVLREINVSSTSEIIKLALTHKIKRIHYISTLDIALLNNHQHLDDAVNALQNQMGYIQTKWVSEKILYQAMKAHQLPVRIYRPGNITGDLINGNIIPFKNHFWLLTKGCLQLGHAPAWDWLVEMTPVDIVADAIVQLSLNSLQNDYSEFNLHNPNYISWIDYIELFGQFGHQCQLIEFTKWKTEHLSIINEHNALHPFKHIYMDDLIQSNKEIAMFTMPELHLKLQSLGINYPNHYPSLIQKYDDQLKSIGFF